MGYALIREDLFVKYSIVDPNCPEGQRIHTFLQALAQSLVGNKIDFEKNPAVFVMADIEAPNAFYAPARNEQERPRRDEDRNIRYIENPLDVPVICVTKGLIDLVDNRDQLELVLGHELTHLILRNAGVRNNSKGEETTANLHAVDMVYDAGSDPKQTLALIDKFNAFAQKAQKEETGPYGNDEKGINWSKILDVHMAYSNTRTALEASLTRLSHLIDDRTPSAFDKAIFDVAYTDPVTAVLTAENYEEQEPLGKLKILIDCIDSLSTKIPVESYYQRRLNALSEQEASLDPNDHSAHYVLRKKKEETQEILAGKRRGHFVGATLEKKYQQKIANLAEDIFRQAREKGGQPPIRVNDLDLYLENKAYQHVKENGYPKVRDPRYFDAASLMYTYFLLLFENHRAYVEDDPSAQILPQIELDMNEAKQRILSAQDMGTFVEAAETLKKLAKIRTDLHSASIDEGSRFTKLENLSLISSAFMKAPPHYELYPELKVGETVPWNNLAEIAKESAESRAYIVSFLKERGIDDYRITQGQPFVRLSRFARHDITEDGKLAAYRQQYELDYALNPALVRQTYTYIRNYFENEETLFQEVCAAILNLTDEDFDERTTESAPKASAKVSNFIHLYNSIPEHTDGDQADLGNNHVRSFISAQFQRENPFPGLNADGDVVLDRNLLAFENPLFQQSFGKDFKKRWLGKKAQYRQRMFDTALKAVSLAAKLWAESEQRDRFLEKEEEALSKQQEALQDKPQEQEEKKQQKEKLRKERGDCRAKKHIAANIISNFTGDILERRRGGASYHINVLTPQQKEIFADLLVKDETGAFYQLLGATHYSIYCDFRQVLSQQIKRVAFGDYTLTDRMKRIAENMGYEKAETREALRKFAEAHRKDTWQISRYARHLHLFDLMQYLEKTPEIDLCDLVKAVRDVEVFPPNRAADTHEAIAKSQYQSYLKLIKKSRLPQAIEKAVSCEKNYENLSVLDLLQTTDSLIALRKQLEFGWAQKASDNKDDKKRIPEASAESDHQDVLTLLDKKIRRTIRSAQNSALEKEDALEKITDLHHLYCTYKSTDFESNGRGDYLKPLIKEEKSLKKIAALSEKEAFWPEDALDHVKAYVFAKKTFLDDVEQEDRLLNAILDKVKTLPAGEKKKECLSILLDKKVRAAHPETRERLFALYSDNVLATLGKDDASVEYQQKLAVVLDELKENKKKDWDKHRLLAQSMSEADRLLLLRQISDKILSQEETSDMIHKAGQITLNAEELEKSYLYGVGVDGLTALMDQRPDIAKRFLQFLNSKGESSDCDDMSADLKTYLRKGTRKLPFWINKDSLLEEANPVRCKLLYENFWSAPLEARSVIVARILKSARNGENENGNKAQQSWEHVFDLVMETLIPPGENSVEGRYARDVMHSYIKARSDYERELILSAMMVANRNIGADAGNVGKALKLFLENMGPAEIKLGQAIASHPNTPKSIAVELQKLKDTADKPSRGTLYEWIRAENIPEELWKDKHIGEILGAASYYVTVDLGEGLVLRLLRPEAREKAAKGFRVVGDAVSDLQNKDRTSDLDYRGLTASVSEMVTQAARMSKIETNTAVGQKQDEFAQEIYNGVEITCEDETFKLKVMAWKARGKNWIVMEKADGFTFNELPENTPREQAYKRKVAKAYAIFELRNILSGRRFDHDRHGAQLCINAKTNEVGIFDTGAMALKEPTIEEQRLLGSVLYDTAKQISGGKGAFRVDALSAALNNKVEELHKAGKDSRYLIEVKKGLLALGDFFKVLGEDGTKDLVSELDLYSHLSKPMKDALTERMSFSEKAQLTVFLASQSLLKDKSGVVDIRQAKTEITNKVACYTKAANKQKKAAWFERTFATEENGAATGNVVPPERSGLSPSAQSLHFAA